MSKRKVDSGISKVINKLHGIDKQEPLVEGVDYTVPKEGEGVQLSQEFIDSMRQRSLELLAQSEGMKEVTSTPIMSAVLKPNPKRAQAQQQSQQAPEEEKKDDAPKKDPNFTKIGPGVVQPLKVNDSEADILGKMFNFMKMEYDWESKQHKKDKKYHKALDEQKERFLDETIEALTGKKPKGTKKSGKSSKKSSLLKTALKGAAGVGMFLLAEKALANVDWKSIVPDFDLGTGGVGGVGTENKEVLGDLSSVKQLVLKAESGGDYNAYNLGKAGVTGPKLDLTKMKIKEVMQLQKEKKVFAAGGFQIIPETMKGVVKGMGLTGEETFDVEMQDKMFQHLLLSKPATKKLYETGDVSLVPQAEEEISGTWAGIKSGKTGKSVYAGVGGNVGTIEASQMESALRRSVIPTQTAIQTTPEVKNTTVPQKLKSPKSAGGTTLGVVNNNTNIINPAPTYTVSQDFVPHYPALIQQQYQLNS